jgi:hypothetical protein
VPPPAADLDDLDIPARSLLANRFNDPARDAPPLVVWVHDQGTQLSAVSVKRMSLANQRACAYDVTLNLGDKQRLELVLKRRPCGGNPAFDLGKRVHRKAVLAQLHRILGSNRANDNGICMV